ncbi:homeobox-leucine zipper protein ROC2-like isoform X1 [Primulina tabacum]|uniref:homeobox-leucine zipper protein ROC2-like isoform X1 n=1 Tax=Primulina tabacum TaxID=48773 RepID=UPI003F5951DF
MTCKFQIVTRRMADKDLIQFDLNLNEAEYVNLVDDHQPNRRRHTQHQIHGMEVFFKDCPNPDNKQRRSLGLELGLEPQQVKFWFQNKRTQLKMQYDHLENAELRAENKRLKDENMSHMEHLKNAACLSCGSPLVIPEISVDEHQLRAENLRLREEIERLSTIAARYIGKPVTDSDNISHRTAPRFMNVAAEWTGFGHRDLCHSLY